MLAVFAVITANYQPSVSRLPQKSSAADGSGSDITASMLAVIPLFSAVLVNNSTAAHGFAGSIRIAQRYHKCRVIVSSILSKRHY